MASTPKPSWWFFPVTFLSILGGLYLWHLVMPRLYPVSESVPLKEAMAMRGQYGDQFGTVNAIIQAAVLALLLSDRRVQRRRNAEQDAQHRSSEELQRRQIEQLEAQHLRHEVRAARLERQSEVEQRRTALLMAVAAQATARTGILAHHQEFHRQSHVILGTEGYPDDLKREAHQAAHTNLKEMSEELRALEITIAGLDRMIDGLKTGLSS